MDFSKLIFAITLNSWMCVLFSQEISSVERQGDSVADTFFSVGKLLELRYAIVVPTDIPDVGGGLPFNIEGKIFTEPELARMALALAQRKEWNRFEFFKGGLVSSKAYVRCICYYAVISISGITEKSQWRQSLFYYPSESRIITAMAREISEAIASHRMPDPKRRQKDEAEKQERDNKGDPVRLKQNDKAKQPGTRTQR